jgi:dGTPase
VHPPLGHLRFPLEKTRGRRYPERPHSYRNEFQRDRDRVIHSRAFRRLENKTQVFASDVSDHFRNRLTHTIEVAQIARTMAGVLGLDEDLTEALALAHDIGHPPFAHAGEAELDRQMQRFGERFDHNLHALRIVERFEVRYPLYPGLNLTFEVREGIVKHSRDFAPGEIPALDEFAAGLRPPLEAQLIDLADEIAYNTADVDDAYSAGMIDVDELRGSCAEFERLWDVALQQFPGATERVRVLEVVRGLVNLLVSGLLEATVQAARELRDAEEVRRAPGRVVVFSESARQTNAQLKKYLRANVYESERIASARGQSVERIGGMFDYFLSHPDRMPENYLEDAASEPLYRVVCDYIAGMTDRYFNRVWGDLNV